ncbi:S1C family serine protease [Streptacidiphilus sp. EB103A]|uniref:S1C family serine protease n=1 Tax=Streptacidiphilus sp. EB103A TaxID=3156275 RepID=UPI003518DF8A
MSETHRNSEGAPEPGVYPYTTGDGTGVDPTVPLPPKPEHAPAAHYGEAPIEGTVLPGDTAPLPGPALPAPAPYAGGSGWGGHDGGAPGEMAHHAAEPAPKKRSRLRRPIALVAAVALVSALAGGVAGGVISADRSNAASYSTGAVVTSDSKSTSNTAAIAAAVTPSTVQITVDSGQSEDIGTGIILTSTGQILTNYHVISAAASDSSATIKITFSNGKTASASVVGTDASLDVAVIKASGVSGLKAASLGDSSSVAIGDSVVAIGNPDGLTGTVTSGIVSALNRKVTVDVSQSTTQSNGGFGFPSWSGEQGSSGSGSSSSSGAQTATYSAIQTDASLNPGNSGGPLLNSSGEVVGINASMYSSSSSSSSSSSAGSVGLGFAIPINAVKAVLSQLQAGHNITS